MPNQKKVREALIVIILGLGLGGNLLLYPERGWMAAMTAIVAAGIVAVSWISNGEGNMTKENDPKEADANSSIIRKIHEAVNFILRAEADKSEFIGNSAMFAVEDIETQKALGFIKVSVFMVPETSHVCPMCEGVGVLREIGDKIYDRSTADS